MKLAEVKESLTGATASFVEDNAIGGKQWAGTIKAFEIPGQPKLSGSIMAAFWVRASVRLG